MRDLISRQAAISAICSACGKIDCDKMDKCEKLQLPPANNSEIPNSSDTISRQAAIDATKKHYRAHDNDLLELIAFDIEQLPSVQPQQIVRCKDCKHNPKLEWFGCPMSHLNEKQRPETAWCWKGERKDDE